LRKTEEQVASIYTDTRKKSKASLYFFAKTVLGKNLLRKHLHLPFANYIQLLPENGGPANSRYKLAWLPREHFKSTICSEALPLWLLLHDRNTSTALISAHSNNTKKWLKFAANTIAYNKWFRFLFPEIRQGDKWDEEQIIVTRDIVKAQSSIAAYSINSGLASQHFPNIILDDPVNEQVAKSAVEMQKAVQLFIDLHDILEAWSNSNFWLPGTPWGREDVIAEALKYEKAGQWLKWGLGALGEFEISDVLKDREELYPKVEIGKPIFPEACPQEKLDFVKQQDVERYYLQYLCRPFEEGRNGFDLGLIRDFVLFPDGRIQCDCHPEHRHMLNSMAVIGLSDPAYTEDKRGCESSFEFVAKDPKCQCRFMLEDYGDRIVPSDYVQKACELAWNQTPWLKHFAVEDVNFQTALKSWLQELQGRPRADGKGTEFPSGISLLGVKPRGRSKDGRTSGMQGSVNNGLWHKRPTMSRRDGNLLDQIAKWPHSRKRDRLDAWSYAEDVWEELGVVPRKYYSSLEDPNIERAIEDFRLIEAEYDS